MVRICKYKNFDYLPDIKSKQTVLFLGQEGVGKTSHLLSLMRHFEDAVYVKLPTFLEKVHIPDASVLFVDECQRLLPGNFLMSLCIRLLRFSSKPSL